jgi:hypothetical protein
VAHWNDIIVLGKMAEMSLENFRRRIMKNDYRYFIFAEYFSDKPRYTGNPD